MLNMIDVFCCYTSCSIKSWFQYRIDAILKSTSVFLREISNAVATYFILSKFEVIDDWTMNEVFLLYGFLFLSYGVLVIFSTGLREFESIIRNGSFDRFLLRPQGLLFQIIGSNADWFAAIGQGGAGLVLFLVGSFYANITWNIYKILFLVLALLCGVLIQFSIFLNIASLSIFLIKANNIRDIFYWNLRKFACYPITIFSPIIKFMLIFVIPFAFVNYFPTLMLLEKNLDNFQKIFVVISELLVSVIMLIQALLFWKYSVKRYKSTGN